MSPDGAQMSEQERHTTPRDDEVRVNGMTFKVGATYIDSSGREYRVVRSETLFMDAAPQGNKASSVSSETDLAASDSEPVAERPPILTSRGLPNNPAGAAPSDDKLHAEGQRAIAQLADDFGLPFGTTVEQVATHARYLQQERARLSVAPSAVARSEPDRAVATAEKLAAQLADLGHWPTWATAEETAALLRALLRRLAPQSAIGARDWEAKYKNDLHNFMALERWLNSHYPSVMEEWEDTPTDRSSAK